MAKKGLGKLVVAATVAGAAAAGISYLKKYKSFNDELEADFHDFEGTDEEEDFFEDEEEENENPIQAADEDKSSENETMDPNTRKYIALNASADELKVAAKDMAAAAGIMAGAVKNVVKDAAAIVSDTAHEAALAARDTAQFARSKMAEKVENYKEQKNAMKTSDDDSIFEDDTIHQTNDEPKSEAPFSDSQQPNVQDLGFVPEKPAGTAELNANAPDSTLDVVKPEEAQKTVSEAEPTTVVEEID